MANRLRVWGIVLGLTGLVMPAVAGETLESVEKKAAESFGRIKTLSAKVDVVGKMLTAGSVVNVEWDGTFIYARLDDDYMSRMDIRGLIQQDGTSVEATMNTVIMGGVMQLYADQGGKPIARRMKAEDIHSSNAAVMMRGLRKENTLKLLPDEKIDGRPVWVVESKPKDPNAGESRAVMFIAKELGLAVKVVRIGSDGKPDSTITFSDIKLGEDIKPHRFVLRIPPGVQVIDTTNE